MLDATRTDFQKSFPPTKRNKASTRIIFSKMECIIDKLYLLYNLLYPCNAYN